MATVRDFFAREAGDYLDRLDRVVEGLDDGALPAAELHRVARALRGSAQMAREDAFARVAAALEGVGRSLSQTPAAWSPDIAGRVRETVSALRALLQTTPEEAVPVADAAVANLSGMESIPATAPAPRMDPAIAFREYAARESAGVLGYVEAALKALAVNSRDREPLKAVLRRQRALMGAARLPSIPVLAETLTAIDEVTRLVARLDVAVEGEWLEVYRGAREVLAPLVKSLQQGADTPTPPALLTLRGLRQQLADRYGSDEPLRQPPVLTPQDAGAPGESVSVEGPAHATAPAAATAQAAAPPRAPAPARTPAAAPAPARAPAAAPATARAPAAAPVAPAARPAGAEPASIQDYLYRGDRALARALELRPALERALASGGAEAKALLAELFDLIELGRA